MKENDEDFGQWLRTFLQEAKLERLKEWQQWLPRITKGISTMTSKLKAAVWIAEGIASSPQAVSEFQPQMTNLLMECQKLLVEINAHLISAELRLIQAEST